MSYFVHSTYLYNIRIMPQMKIYEHRVSKKSVKNTWHNILSKKFPVVVDNRIFSSFEH